MEQLIPITGYAKTYKELCNKIAQPGEFYNVLEEKPFMTYSKIDGVEIGDTLEETDVEGHFQVKAELESNVLNPQEGDVYIVGLSAPYTRWKAQYVNYIMTWVEDGQEEKKIVHHYKTEVGMKRKKLPPEEGIFYSIGEQKPYRVFGVVSSWEPVGTFLSYIGDNLDYFEEGRVKYNPGEILYIKGVYYLYTGPKREGNDGWVVLDIPEPIENAYKHVFESRGGKYKIREGVKLGTLEFYQVKE